MSELLVELFSEEIPARMQEGAASQFLKLLTDEFQALSLQFSSANYYYTPRRIAVCIDGIAAEIPERVEIVKGPRVESDKAALDGFVKRHNLNAISDCAIEGTGASAQYMLKKIYPQKHTVDILGESITRAITNMTWPKSMRWGSNSMRWARPLHNILAIFDGKTIEGSIAVGESTSIAFSNVTFGHRFMAGLNPIPVSNFASYEQALRNASVILNQNERKDTVWNLVTTLAQKSNYTVKPDAGLLSEVTGLVECPTPFIGEFPEEYLELPPEVISTSMREHQRYFSVLDANGTFSNHFVCVANIVPKDGGVAIRRGNEKVLRARLSDARFFWQQDKSSALESYLSNLNDIRFHEKLGSMGEKANRLSALAEFIAQKIGADKAAASRAALLAKADLTTSMVREFPELQGTMGGYYARTSGEQNAVADAIASHYSPLGPNDTCPTDKVAIAVALADKIDNLVGFFSVDIKPTGNKDPFALRRAALGVLRLVLENNLDLNVSDIINESKRLYNFNGSLESLETFIVDRFLIMQKDAGISKAILDALVSKEALTHLSAVVQKSKDLMKFIESKEGQSILAAYKRAYNILASAQKAGATLDNLIINPSLFAAAEESALHNAITQVSVKVVDDIRAGKDSTALEHLAPLAPMMESFFTSVMVMAPEEDIRANRLALVTTLIGITKEMKFFKSLCQ